MTPAEALTVLRRWRARDEEANLAVRRVLDSYGYDNLTQLQLEDPDLLVFIHDALEPLLEMDRQFAIEDALVREGRREVTGNLMPLPPPNPETDRRHDRPAP